MAINDVPDSGVADNEAFGNMFGRRYGRNNSWRRNVGFGNGGGGGGGRNSGIVVNGNSFASERQLTNYMKNIDAMKDADNQRGQDTSRHESELQDWSRGRAGEHLTKFATDNPHTTRADLDKASASWNPGFAPAPKPTNVVKPTRPVSSKGKMASTKDVEAAVRAGHITPEEATGFDSKTGLSATYSKKFAANAAANNGKSKGRQFTGPTPMSGGPSGGAASGGAVSTPVK
jgi:hypothetical protein